MAWFWGTLREFGAALMGLFGFCIVAGIVGSFGLALRAGIVRVRAGRAKHAAGWLAYGLAGAGACTAAVLWSHCDLFVGVVVVGVYMLGFFGRFIVPGDWGLA